MTPPPSQPPVPVAGTEQCFVQGMEQGSAPAPANTSSVGMLSGAMSAELQQVVVERPVAPVYLVKSGVADRMQGRHRSCSCFSMSSQGSGRRIMADAPDNGLGTPGGATGLDLQGGGHGILLTRILTVQDVPAGTVRIAAGGVPIAERVFVPPAEAALSLRFQIHFRSQCSRRLVRCNSPVS